VLVLGREAGRGARTVAAVQDAGGQAEFVAADVSDPQRLAELAEEIGDIEILVNNAGFAIWGATPDLGVDEFDGMFAANVRAPYYLVAAFAPGMSARGHGSIINIGSMAGTVGLVGGAAYGATKAALGALTRAVGRRVQPHRRARQQRSRRDRSTRARRRASCSPPSATRPPSSAADRAR